jgi:long-chain acyl-CoA synthetase
MHLGQIVENQVKERAKEAALIYEGREISFGELNKAVNKVANGLQNLGIQRDDRVAIMLPNIPEFVYTFYACQKLGAVAVPFNTMYKGKEISHILLDSGAKAIVCLTNFVPLINEIRSELPDLEHILTTGERTLTFADPESTIFVQAVLSKNLFTDLDDAYRKTGEAMAEGLLQLDLSGVWYRHRGSLRIGGKKLSGFLISEVEDAYVINVICFKGKFDASDFFAAIWIPPEVKDKILEPLTSLREELGKDFSDDELKNALVSGLEKSFNVKLSEGSMTREETFGYEKQRSLAFKGVKRPASKRKSIFKKLSGMFSKGKK